MRELIGQCYQCNRPIYCEDGFLEGFIDSEGNLSCFEARHGEPQAVKEAESMEAAVIEMLEDEKHRK